MSIRFVIDEQRHKVALFCSTDGFAFGPVLESEDEAERFIAFAIAYGEEVWAAGKDLRSYTPAQLDEIRTAFVRAEAEDAQTTRERER